MRHSRFGRCQVWRSRVFPLCKLMRGLLKFFSKMTSSGIPHFAAGTVVKGFGRGSKELGIPTANFAESIVESLPEDTKTGIYYGLARVTDGPVYKMVMSVGWNPYYNNTKKSMETHILHKFSEDFYGAYLRVVMLGYIRPEKNYDSLDALIAAIQNDIKVAEESLSSTEFAEYYSHPFLCEPTADAIKKLPKDNQEQPKDNQEQPRDNQTNGVANGHAEK